MSGWWNETGAPGEGHHGVISVEVPRSCRNLARRLGWREFRGAGSGEPSVHLLRFGLLRRAPSRFPRVHCHPYR